MSATCRSFRALLELKLSGRTAQSELVVLSWHEHLVGCGVCRKLLEAEEALELLLASLPEPNLPAELARRVVSRLRAARRSDVAEAGLDALLDLAPSEAPPARLAESVLARLRGAREEAAAPVETARAVHGAETHAARLEALLDLDRAVAVPDGLAGRVLAGLRSVRHDERRSAASRFALRPQARWIFAAAAVVVALWVAWTLWQRLPGARSERREDLVHGERSPNAAGAGNTNGTGERPIRGDAALPEPQMLAVLDVLEQWDLLMHADIDVLLSTLDPAELDTSDEAPDEPVAPPPQTTPAEPRSKG